MSSSNSSGRPGLRVTAPPGGRSSDIFSPASNEENASPRKTRDYQKSRIFEADANSNEVIKKTLRASSGDTQDRLFGAGMSDQSPRKLNDTYKSSVFSTEPENSIVTTPKKKLERNPITGAVQNGIENGHLDNTGNGRITPQTNGYYNDGE